MSIDNHQMTCGKRGKNPSQQTPPFTDWERDNLLIPTEYQCSGRYLGCYLSVSNNWWAMRIQTLWDKDEHAAVHPKDLELTIFNVIGISPMLPAKVHILKIEI